MRLLLIAGTVLLTIGIGITTKAMTPWGGSRTIGVSTPIANQQGISLIAMNGLSFVAGSASGTAVGTASAIMEPPAPTFSGNWSTSNANFTFSGAVLKLATTLCPGGGCSYVVPVTATEPGVANSPKTMTFTVNVTGGGTAINHIGAQDINAYAYTVAEMDAEFSAMQAAHIVWDRVSMGAWVNGCSGTFYNTWVNIMKEANKYGINVLWILEGPGRSGCGGGSATPTNGQSPPRDIPLYITQFVKPIVQAMASVPTPDGKHYYESWNEPFVGAGNAWLASGGTGTIANFGQWVQQIYTEIHADDPNGFFVVDGGSVVWPPFTNGIYKDSLLSYSQTGIINGATHYFDALSPHMYPACGPSNWGSDSLRCIGAPFGIRGDRWLSIYTDNAVAGFQSFKAELASYGISNIPIWTTEIGCHTQFSPNDTTNQCTCAQMQALYASLFNDATTRYANEGPIITFAWKGANVNTDNYNIALNGCGIPAQLAGYSGIW